MSNSRIDGIRKVDSILSALAKSINQSDRKGGRRDRGKITADIWGAAIASVSFGPKKPNGYERRALQKAALRLGGQLYEATDSPLCLSLSVGKDSPSGQPYDARKVCKLVQEMRETLLALPRLGCQIEISRGFISNDLPFGSAYDDALAKADGLLPGHMRQSQAVVDCISPLGMPAGIRLNSGDYELALPIDSRSWLTQVIDLAHGQFRAIIQGDYALNIGFPEATYRRASNAVPRLAWAHGVNRESTEKTSEASELCILAHGASLEIECNVEGTTWVYLLLQSDNKLSLPLDHEPFREPRDNTFVQLGLVLDDEEVVNRPILLMSHDRISGLEALVEKINDNDEWDAERQIGCLQQGLLKEGLQDFSLLDLGLFAHNFDPNEAWQAGFRDAKMALGLYENERARVQLQKLLHRPLGQAKRAETLLFYGIACRKTAHGEQGLERLMEAETLAQYVEAKGLLARVRLEMGRSFVEMGQAERALGYLNAAFQGFEAEGEALDRARTQFELGVAYRRLDRFADSFKAYSAALSLMEKGSASNLFASILEGLGQTNQDLYHLNEAFDYFSQALAMYQSLGLSKGEMQARLELGFLTCQMKQYEDSLAHSSRALELAQTHGSTKDRALINLCRGMAYEDIGQYAEGIQSYELSLQGMPPNPSVYRAGIHMCLARIYRRMGDRSSTKENLDRFDSYEPSLPAELKWQVALIKAHLAEQEEEVGISDIYFHGVQAIEQVREDLPHLLRTQFLEHSQQLFEGWVGCLYKEGAEAGTLLDAVERARGRAFLDAMLCSLHGQKRIEDTDLLAMAEWLPKSKPKSTDEIQTHLPPELTLLAYHCLPDQVLAFVTRHDQVEVKSLDLSLVQVRELADGARRSGQNRGEGLCPEAWLRFSDALIKPILEWLPEDPEAPIAVIQHGPLYGLPFHALPHPETHNPLIMHHSVFYVPSLQALNCWLQPSSLSSDQVMILADSKGDLTHAVKEAFMVSDTLGQGSVYIGAQATEEVLLKSCSNIRYLHLAVHGHRAKAGQPASITLAKANESGQTIEVTAEQITKSPLSNTELAVLSACESGSGELSPAGEGPDLLSWAFLMAGCRSVISSAWKVDDAATKLLMTHFYSALAQGKSKLQALTYAQRALIVNDQAMSTSKSRAVLSVRKGPPALLTSDPHYWAAFSLLGDWR